MGMVVSFTAVTSAELDRAYLDPEWRDEMLWERANSDALSVYLDKAWAGLQYLMDEEELLIEFMWDGDMITDDGALFGWAVDTVAETAEIVKTVPFERLAAHFDPEAMTAADVYPRVWNHGPSGGIDYLKVHYEKLVEFFTAADTKSAAIMSFSF